MNSEQQKNCIIIQQNGIEKLEEERYPFYVWDTSKGATEQ